MVDYTNVILIPLGVSIASVIIWESCKFVIPRGIYLPIEKFRRSFQLRNTAYPTKIFKSYELVKNDDNVIDVLRKRIDVIFKDLQLEYMESNNDNLSFQIENENVVCKFYIDINLEDDPHLNVKIASILNFKKLKDGLDILFWALTDLYEELADYITPTTSAREIKVKIDIKEMDLLSELFEVTGSNVIISNNISLQKEKDYTKLILSGKRGPELANKIKNIIVLGSLQ